MRLKDKLMQEGTPIGIDCEGARLGRFGAMSLMQVSLSDGTVALIDTLKPNTVAALRCVLESPKILKVFHDSREDSAALYHQFGRIQLRKVFDTQVASLLLQEESELPLRQTGYLDLAAERSLATPTESFCEIKAQMKEVPFLWHQRPLTRELLEYAIQGVKFLLPLYTSLKSEIDEEIVENVSNNWIEYAQLNMDVAQNVKIGTPLLGTVAAVTDRGIFFKLNLGKTGVCCTPSAMKRILAQSVQVGDTIELAVSGIALNGTSIYVDRRDPDWEFFDFNRRPSRAKKRMGLNEYLHVPSLIEDAESVDPLLRRGIGKTIDSDSDGETDHDPILTHKPIRKIR